MTTGPASPDPSRVGGAGRGPGRPGPSRAGAVFREEGPVPSPSTRGRTDPPPSLGRGQQKAAVLIRPPASPAPRGREGPVPRALAPGLGRRLEATAGTCEPSRFVGRTPGSFTPVRRQGSWTLLGSHGARGPGTPCVQVGSGSDAKDSALDPALPASAVTRARGAGADGAPRGPADPAASIPRR